MKALFNMLFRRKKKSEPDIEYENLLKIVDARIAKIEIMLHHPLFPKEDPMGQYYQELYETATRELREKKEE